MEAGDSTARQSGPSTANSLDHYNRRPRERIETYHEGGSMATATLVSPGSGYHSHHSSFSSGYPHSAPPTSIPGMISPIEPRRPSDEGESSHGHRQSLPSISEVMGTKSMAFPPPAAQLPQPQTLPSPFAPSGPPRPFDPTGDRNASPRALHPSTTSFPRPETLPAFDHARPSLASRPAPPPLNTFTATHQPPMPTKHEQQHSIDSAHSEAHPLSANHRPPTQSLPSLYQETRQLPPGQLPLSAYPVSPRHTGPTLPSPYESQRSSTYGNEESESAHPRTAETRSAIDRSFESWGYETNLSTVANACRTGYNLAEAYLAAAREHQPSSLIPSRMPTENELSEVINSLMMGLKKLEDIRDMVHTTRLNSERARENGGGKDDEDVNMFGDGIKQPYGMGEVKKRRGRAAPPGRCHSCNRVDTPEWRRGPDGARTLCNACGLHYAKLERKRLTDQRSIRPKPSDDRH